MSDRPSEVGRFRIVVVGVGGQGVLTAARLLGEGARAAGLSAMVGQLHGMSQRGGSVESTVVIGPGGGTFVGPGEADVILGLEPLETQRAAARMSARTTVLYNRNPIVPFEMTLHGQEYPSLSALENSFRAVAGVVIAVDCLGAAREAGDERSVNVAGLGALAALEVLPFGEDALVSAVEERIPSRHLEVNLRAFRLGRELVAGPPSETATTMGGQS
jgi:indolepyruvate ferredoxin oxidoreductase, beta subunit